MISFDTIVLMEIFSFLGSAFGVVTLIAGSILIIKARANTTTIESQKELINTLMIVKDEQKEQIKDLNEKHLESTKAIANLQGQLDSMKNIPLKEIAEDMKTIATTQRDIIELLKGINTHGKSTR